MVGYREAAKIASCIMTILILNVMFRCVDSAAAHQSSSSAKKTTQSNPKDSMEAEKKQSAVAANAEDEKTENKPQMDEQREVTTMNTHNDVEQMTTKMTTPNPMKTTTPGNGNHSTGGSMSVKNATNSSKSKDEAEMFRCNTTKDCAAYMGSECINKTRCLCGNWNVPKNNGSCKDVRRYVTFPCKEHAECVENADCVREDSAHGNTCSCKAGFEPTTDHSLCLNDVGRLKMVHETDFIKVQKLLRTLQRGQQTVKERLRMLENTSMRMIPSAALLLAGTLLSVR